MWPTTPPEAELSQILALVLKDICIGGLKLRKKLH